MLTKAISNHTVVERLVVSSGQYYEISAALKNALDFMEIDLFFSLL